MGKDAILATRAVGERIGTTVIALVLPFVACSLFVSLVISADCGAAEPPTVDELLRAHSELRAAVANVKGEFHLFRTETVVPEARDRLPDDLGLPLIFSGCLWRSPDMFRADFSAHHFDNEGEKTIQQSVAVDEGRAYEFSEGAEIGALRVCDTGTREAQTISSFVETRFHRYLDALWSVGSGVSVVDLLQRPSTQLDSNPQNEIVDGFSLKLSDEDGTEGCVVLGMTRNYPLRHQEGPEEWLQAMSPLVRTATRWLRHV